MPKVATGYYAVCKGREIGVFTNWEEAQSHVQGYAGAKFKKFKTEPEAEKWYKSNLPPSSPKQRATTATPTSPTLKDFFSSSSSTRVTRSPSKPRPTTVSKQVPQPIPKAVTTAVSGPAQSPKIAAPKNTAVDIVYSDGACKSNGGRNAVAGIGVWWGPNDPRNISERCPGGQTNNRAELIAIARVFETVPLSTNTLIIRTDSQYSRKALTEWSFNWRKNGWKNAGGNPVANKELIDYILTLLETRQRSGQPVQLEYVKGHSGDVGNDGADALAVAGCGHPDIPDKDWISLKKAYVLNPEQDIMADIADMADIDLTDFILSDEDLMRELEEDG